MKDKISLYLFTFFLFLILSSSFFRNTTIPNDLVFFKEIWIVLFIGFVCVITAGMILIYNNDLSINWIDVLVGFNLFSILLNKFVFGETLDFSFVVSLSFISIFFSIKYFFSSLKSLQETIILSLFGIIAVIQVTIGIMQFSGVLYSTNSNLNVTGYFFNSGPYVIFTTALFLACLPLLLKKPNRKWKQYIYILFTIFFLFILIVTKSRSTWLALTFVTILYLFLINNFNLVKQRLLVSIPALIVFLLFFLTLMALYKKDSSIGRILIWQNTLSIIKNNVLFGVGVGNFDKAYAESQASFFIHNKTSKFVDVAGDVRFAFNDYLQILAEQGLVGLLLFGTLIFFLLFYSFRYFNRSLLIQACVLPICFILITGFFTYSLQVVEIKILFWQLIAILSTEIIKYTPVNIHSFKKSKLISSSASILFGSSLIFYSVVRWNAFITFERFCNWGVGFEQKYMSDFKSMLRYINDDPNFNIYYAENLWNSKQHNSAIKYIEVAISNIPEKELYYLLATFYERKKKYDQAEKCYEFVINYQPNILYPRYLLALFYKRTNKKEMWLKSTDIILSFKPKIQSSQIEMMKNEIKVLLDTQY